MDANAQAWLVESIREMTDDQRRVLELSSLAMMAEALQRIAAALEAGRDLAERSDEP